MRTAKINYDPTLSLEYQNALFENTEAISKFRLIENKFRSNQCSDAEYLLARKEYKLSQEKFDNSFEKERNK